MAGGKEEVCVAGGVEGEEDDEGEVCCTPPIIDVISMG